MTVTLREIKAWLNTQEDLQIITDWTQVPSNTDIVDDLGFNYYGFIDLMERIMLHYNRIIEPIDYNKLYNISRIVNFINNTEPPKDERGKMFLLRKRMEYYS